MPTYTPQTVSAVTVADVADYLRLTEVTTSDEQFLTTALEASKKFVYHYTGLTPLQADAYNELVIAVLVLCQDMFDNRTMYVDSSNVNKVVEAILGLHSVNLL